MDRLTETNNYIGFMETYLNINCEECQYKNIEECEEYKNECKAVANFKCFINDMYSKLKSYEDLDEQRKLIKLPCAIGDIVYWLCGTEILKMEIEYFQILPKIKFSFKYCGGGRRLENFTKYMCDSDIGKNVFFTREEAETALKLQNRWY